MDFELFSQSSEIFDEALRGRGCSELEGFLLSSFFCKSPQSRCCERGLASAGGDEVVPLQQQVVPIS